MKYLAGKNTIKDSYSLVSYTIHNESQYIIVVLVSAIIQNNEIHTENKQITIKNMGEMILDPDFQKPEGFIQSEPNTWGIGILPKVTNPEKEFWEFYKSKESLGSEKAIFETLIEMGELPKNGIYKN